MATATEEAKGQQPEADPPSSLSYEDRRRHIKALLYSLETDLWTVARWTGRETLSRYQYLWQVVNGAQAKQSEAVLDDLERALKAKGYWVDYGELEVSS